MKPEMTIYNDLVQGTPEWLAIRLGKFTASSALAISTGGAGLETLCFEKAAEIKTGKAAKESYTNGDMDRGNENEPLARNAYELETGSMVTIVGFVGKNKRVGCSPDGFVGEDGLLEIKCPNDVNYIKYILDPEIPKKYYLQMQMQMDVTGRKWCDYVVFNANFIDRPIIIKRVERDEEAIEKIRLGTEKGSERVDGILAAI
jgi:putative phage-type endonuclease